MDEGNCLLGLDRLSLKQGRVYFVGNMPLLFLIACQLHQLLPSPPPPPHHRHLPLLRALCAKAPELLRSSSRRRGCGWAGAGRLLVQAACQCIMSDVDKDIV